MRIQSVKAQSTNFEAKKFKKPDLSQVTAARIDYFLRGQRGGQKPSGTSKLKTMVGGFFSRHLGS